MLAWYNKARVLAPLGAGTVSRFLEGLHLAGTVKQLVTDLVKSRLMTEDEVQAVHAALPRDRKPPDAESFAAELVAADKLTPYQAQQLMAGQTDGLVLGNYVILDKLGQGGMGLVLKAEHRRMKRVVALKVLSPHVTRTPDLLRRFQREVEAAAKLSHPNIVIAHDADEAGGTYFLVMEYVEGTDLSALVKRDGPLPIGQALDYILQAARGLEYAHRHGVIHRDIKPGNLLLECGDLSPLSLSRPGSPQAELAATESYSGKATEAKKESGDKSPHSKGRLKILDMGLARVESAGGTQDELTGSGQIMGTVDYMAPEQAVSTKHADQRADIYSLGLTLWYLLTGRPAYPGQTAVEKLMARQTAPIPSLRDACPGVPSALEAVFAKLVAKTPEARYQTMAEVIADLEQFLRSEPSVAAVRAAGCQSPAGRQNEEPVKLVHRATAYREAPTSCHHHQTVLLGGMRGHAGRVRTGGRQQSERLQDAHLSGRVRELGAGIEVLRQADYVGSRAGVACRVSTANRSRVGVCLPGRNIYGLVWD